MNTEPVEVEEVPCPNCGGRGIKITYDDVERVEDWQICPRCHGVGTILIKIKKDQSYDF